MLVLLLFFKKSLIYLFVLCTIAVGSTVFWMMSFFDSWYIALASYLFFGGILCVLAYFSSFSFSSLRVSSPYFLVFFSIFFSVPLTYSCRFRYLSGNEIGMSWVGTESLVILSCSLLLLVMFFFLIMSKKNWGGVRIFSI